MISQVKVHAIWGPTNSGESLAVIADHGAQQDPQRASLRGGKPGSTPRSFLTRSGWLRRTPGHDAWCALGIKVLKAKKVVRSPIPPVTACPP